MIKKRKMYKQQPSSTGIQNEEIEEIIERCLSCGERRGFINMKENFEKC